MLEVAFFLLKMCSCVLNLNLNLNFGIDAFAIDVSVRNLSG